MIMTENIFIIILIACIVFLIFSAIYTMVERKKTLAEFKPGRFIDYYIRSGHGKFRKERLVLTYEIIDVDRYYALAKNLENGKEEELNLQLDMKYSDKMVLREADGTVIKIFEFE